MEILWKIIGPRSKYDRTLPYTYMAKVPALAGEDEASSHYFADTLCGLIECLEKNKITAEDTQLFGVYLDKEFLLEKAHCTTADGRWLHRPEICKILEAHYKRTLDRHYKGHREQGPCAFEDRERQGSGPH